MLFKRRKTKVFCIGKNKTGTTSLTKALTDLGYKMGDQTEGEWLSDKWYTRDFSGLKNYCQKSDAFQDIPFSRKFTYIYLDQIFPGSKFILSIRDSAEQWYYSLVSFHAKTFASDSKTVTADDLKNATYLYPGFAYKSFKELYQTPDDDLYNKEMLIHQYNTHNEAIFEYFRGKPDQLLVLNVGEKDAYKKFCAFLNKKPVYEEFPWELKTENLSWNFD